MKIIAVFAASALAAGTIMAAAPADAQRYGWHGDRGGRWHDGRGYRRDRWHGPRHGYGWRGGYRGYRGGYGWRGGYGRPRVVCRIHPGYYGPVRRCFRR